MDYEWRIDEPALFTNDNDWYSHMALISPMWGRVDEISLKYFTDGLVKSASYYQVSFTSGFC